MQTKQNVQDDVYTEDGAGSFDVSGQEFFCMFCLFLRGEFNR